MTYEELEKLLKEVLNDSGLEEDFGVAEDDEYFKRLKEFRQAFRKIVKEIYPNHFEAFRKRKFPTPAKIRLLRYHYNDELKRLSKAISDCLGDMTSQEFNIFLNTAGSGLREYMELWRESGIIWNTDWSAERYAELYYVLFNGYVCVDTDLRDHVLRIRRAAYVFAVRIVDTSPSLLNSIFSKTDASNKDSWRMFLSSVARLCNNFFWFWSMMRRKGLFWPRLWKPFHAISLDRFVAEVANLLCSYLEDRHASFNSFAQDLVRMSKNELVLDLLSCSGKDLLDFADLLFPSVSVTASIITDEGVLSEPLNLILVPKVISELRTKCEGKPCFDIMADYICFVAC